MSFARVTVAQSETRGVLARNAPTRAGVPAAQKRREKKRTPTVARTRRPHLPLPLTTGALSRTFGHDGESAEAFSDHRCPSGQLRAETPARPKLPVRELADRYDLSFAASTEDRPQTRALRIARARLPKHNRPTVPGVRPISAALPLPHRVPLSARLFHQNVTCHPAAPATNTRPAGFPSQCSGFGEFRSRFRSAR